MDKSIEKIPSQIRRDILRMVHAVQSGHPGGSLGCAEFFVALYFKILNHDKESFNMNGQNEDIFFLSNGHISPVFYSVLARAGYFSIDELSTFRKLNSRLQGHPTTHEGLPGVRIASGSLGQGLSVALGAAEAKKLSNDNNLVFSLHGDGELQEGQIWEAALYAGSKNIDNKSTMDASLIPEIFVLYQNYPNPFNSNTRISFDLLQDAILSLYVTDATGRIKTIFSDNELYNSGKYNFDWNAESFSTGVYFFTINAEVEGYLPILFSRKMIYLK